MDGSRFDAWTRRRIGLAAGGVTLSLLGLFTLGEDAAGKKRCKRLGKRCTKPKRCCGKLDCDIPATTMSEQKRCCKRKGKPCTSDPNCCQGLLCCGSPRVCSEVCLSDRAVKANFATVDPADMLARVQRLPISTWNYTSDDPAIRHIGPMAQDVAALFGVGDDDRHIHPIDGQGIALAAIQGLAARIEALHADNARLAARIEELERPE